MRYNVRFELIASFRVIEIDERRRKERKEQKKWGKSEGKFIRPRGKSSNSDFLSHRIIDNDQRDFVSSSFIPAFTYVHTYVYVIHTKYVYMCVHACICVIDLFLSEETR